MGTLYLSGLDVVGWSMGVMHTAHPQEVDHDILWGVYVFGVADDEVWVVRFVVFYV